jgi:hypothetical protein
MRLRARRRAAPVIVDIAQSYTTCSADPFAKEPDLNITPAASTNSPPQKELAAAAAQRMAQAKAKAAQIGQAIGPMVGEAMSRGKCPRPAGPEAWTCRAC